MNADTATGSQASRASGAMPSQQAGELKDNVSEAIGRGTAGIAKSAQSAGENLTEDLSNLRADLASMQRTMMTLMSEVRGQATKSAVNVGQAVSSQVSAATSDFVHAGTEMASQARDQMKTFASELEATARKNPLGTLAATLVAGIVIGMMSRGRS